VNLYLVRHAHAGDRHDWNGPDVGRPLSKKGRQQAEALTGALAGEPIQRILSSPAVRCTQTAAPIAVRLGLTVEQLPALAEGAPLAPARALIDSLATDGRDTVICGHGDLIPELLHDLESEGTPVDGAACAKGSIWHLVAQNGRFVRAVYRGRPDPAMTRGD
jgi:broad specificity phosphatase PhoE